MKFSQSVAGVAGCVLALVVATSSHAASSRSSVTEKNPNCSPPPVSAVRLASPILPELDYKACCKVEECSEIDVIGCDPTACVSTDLRPDGCEPGYIVANCESASYGTACTPEITLRLGLTRVVPPEGTARPLGCCAYCPGGADSNCEACASVDSHDECGALIPAECSLYFGVFGCQRAGETE